jgi:hypothetical protein
MNHCSSEELLTVFGREWHVENSQSTKVKYTQTGGMVDRGTFASLESVFRMQNVMTVGVMNELQDLINRLSLAMML